MYVPLLSSHCTLIRSNLTLLTFYTKNCKPPLSPLSPSEDILWNHLLTYYGNSRHKSTDMASKQDIINERKANLPLPEQPPTASDWNSADARNVNVGSGGQAAGLSGDGGLAGSNLREPATTDEVGKSGREGKDNLGGLPNDAVTSDKKNHPGLVNTTNKDYGYPEKNDPSSGLK